MMDEEAREKIRTEPLEMGDLFAYSHAYFSSEIAIVLGISFFFALPWYFLLYGLESSFDFLLLIAFMFIWVIGALILPFFVIWATSMMKQTIDLSEASNEEAWRTAWSRYIPLAWVLLLQTLTIIARLFLLVVPGVIRLVSYSFSIYVVSVLPLNGEAALEHSRDLIKGRWWLACGLLLSFTIPSYVLPFVIAPSNMILHALTSSLFSLITPYSLFPYGIWFLNLHYLRERAAGEGANPETPTE